MTKQVKIQLDQDVNAIEFRDTAVRYETPVGKSLFLKPDGSLGKDMLPKARTGQIEAFNGTLAAHLAWLESLGANGSTHTGTFEADAGDVVWKAHLASSPGAVAASKQFLEFREGPGLLKVDTDWKSDSEVVAQAHQANSRRLDFEDMPNIVDKLLPQADGVQMAVMDSTSANIYAPDGTELNGAGRFRTILPVSDARDIPRIMGIMHDRAYLVGLGWAFVATDGRIHHCSPVDMALARPAQSDFTGPELRDGLTQKRRRQHLPGEVAFVDTATVPDLTPSEAAAVRAAKDALAAQLKEPAAAARAAWLAAQAKRAVARGVAPERAHAASIRLLEQGVLCPVDEIIFEDNTAVSCGTLLTAGAEYDGRVCFDPVEPEYDGGRPVGIFYWNNGERPGVHSFAHGSRWYSINHDEESVRAVIEAKGNIALAMALLSDIDGVALARLEGEAAKALGLGNSRKPLREDIARLKASMGRGDGGHSSPTHKLKIDAGEWPHNQALPAGLWAHLTDTGNPMAHQSNVAILLKAYGIKLEYNVILKDWDWTLRGVAHGTDNADGSFLTHVHDLCTLNKMSVSTNDVLRHLTTGADAHQVNPVTDYLSELVWDGKTRIPALAAALDPHDKTIAELSLRRALIQACAAADGAAIARKIHPHYRPVYEYVLAFLGSQGAGKTKGLSGIVPEALQQYVKTSVVLSVRDKDSVMAAVSGWICELGEGDASFSRTDQTSFKAFTSREVDEVRRPYSATYSRFQRRTVFFGTLNAENFLRDPTGSRRFLPLRVSRGFPHWSPGEVDQLWAEHWAAYAGGEQWWPTAEEARLLKANAEEFRQRTSVEEHLYNDYDWESGAPNGIDRVTASFLASKSHDFRKDATGLRELGEALELLWRQHGAVLHEGFLKILVKGVYVKVNATGGQNRGWLLPAKRLSGFGEMSFPTIPGANP